MNTATEPNRKQIWAEVYSTLLVRTGWGATFFLIGYSWSHASNPWLKLVFLSVAGALFLISLRLEYRRAKTRLTRIIQADNQRMTIGRLHQSLPINNWVNLPQWGIQVKRAPEPCESNGGHDE